MLPLPPNAFSLCKQMNRTRRNLRVGGLEDLKSFRLGMVEKRREGVQVLTKQGDKISLGLMLKPLLNSHTQRCHVEGHQEADFVAVRGSFQMRAQRITDGRLRFHQRKEIDGSDRWGLHGHLIADQK